MISPKRMTPIDGGVEGGIHWCIVRAPLWGAINGYAQMPEGHVWRAASLQGDDYGLIDVSGGVTFGPTDDGWVGFDTLHAGDFWPGSDAPHFCNPGKCDCIVWTQEMVVAETKCMARQIAAADPTLATAVSA